jgi:holin-like protein
VLKYLTLILCCQLVGEIITKVARLPIPGPVIGMVLLFCGLVLHRKIPSELDEAGGLLLRYLPLLFVPAGVGVITYLDLLVKSWAPIAAAILIGTVLTIAVTGIVMQFLNRRQLPDTDKPLP